MLQSAQRLQKELFLPAAPGLPVEALAGENPELLSRGIRVCYGVRRCCVELPGIEEVIAGTGGKKVNVHGFQCLRLGRVGGQGHGLTYR